MKSRIEKEKAIVEIEQKIKDMDDRLFDFNRAIGNMEDGVEEVGDREKRDRKTISMLTQGLMRLDERIGRLEGLLLEDRKRS